MANGGLTKVKTIEYIYYNNWSMVYDRVSVSPRVSSPPFPGGFFCPYTASNSRLQRRIPAKQGPAMPTLIHPSSSLFVYGFNLRREIIDKQRQAL
jgi:hypothetical protein